MFVMTYAFSFQQYLVLIAGLVIHKVDLFKNTLENFVANEITLLEFLLVLIHM